MLIAGIDPSIESTGKCIMGLDNDTFDVIGIKFYGYTKVKKTCFTSEDGNLEIFHVGSKYSSMNMCDRQNIAYEYLKKDMEDVDYVALEGYAFGKKITRSLVQLGEFIGGMKKMFYDQGKGLMIYPPRMVKRFAIGDGNADKISMCEMFKKEFPQWYPEDLIRLKQYETPHSDICDAFWIAETLRNHIMYEVIGPEKMDEGTVAFLEHKSTKKSSSIVESELIKKK